MHHRLGKLRILMCAMEEGKRCYLNPKDYISIDGYGWPYKLII